MWRAMNVEHLQRYINEDMRMSHVYQPVMLLELLKSGGEASIEQIAKAMLLHDRSQIEYYEIRTKNMVGKVLTNNGIVDPVKLAGRIVGYRLKDISNMSAEDRSTLIGQCEGKIADYIEKRGDSIWKHRFNAKGYGTPSQSSMRFVASAHTRTVSCRHLCCSSLSQFISLPS